MSTQDRAQCEICKQTIFDARHQHPHDYFGSLEGLERGVPCTACNRVHPTDRAPSAPALRADTI